MTFVALNYQSPKRELPSQDYFLCPLPCVTVGLPANVHPLKSVPMQKHSGTVYYTPDRRKLQTAWLFLLQLLIVSVLDARQKLSVFLDFFMYASVWCIHARIHMPMCTYGESPHCFLPLLFPTLFFKITRSSSIGQQSPRNLLSLPPDTGITCMYNCTGFFTWVLGILTARISLTEPSPPNLFLNISKL